MESSFCRLVRTLGSVKVICRLASSLRAQTSFLFARDFRRREGIQISLPKDGCNPSIVKVQPYQFKLILNSNNHGVSSGNTGEKCCDKILQIHFKHLASSLRAQIDPHLNGLENWSMALQVQHRKILHIGSNLSKSKGTGKWKFFLLEDISDQT